MPSKEFVKPFGATTATTISLTQPYHGGGHRVESWFGSVKCASELMKRGLYCIMLVKTAHKDFPQQLLGAKKLQCSEWVAYSTERNGVKLLVCRFRDLKIKDFISTCSTSIPDKPRSTQHHGLVNQPQVGEQYLQAAAAAINIHNHNQSGSAALEDVWHTKSPRRRQLAGILGFCFTNAFLTMKCFTDKNLKHHTFKMAAAQALTNYQTINLCKNRQLQKSSITEDALHMMAKHPNSRNCYYCWHGYSTSQTNHKSTTFKCV